MRNLILLSAGKKHVSSSSSSSSTTIGKNHPESSVAKVENSEENSFQLTKLPQAEKEEEKTLDQKTLIKTLVEQRNQKRVCEPSKGNQKIRNYKCILYLLILCICRHFIHWCQFQRIDGNSLFRTTRRQVQICKQKSKLRSGFHVK